MVATVGESRLQAPTLMFYQMWQHPGPEVGWPPAILVGKYGWSERGKEGGQELHSAS